MRLITKSNTFLSLSQKKYLTIYDMHITNITKLNVTHLCVGMKEKTEAWVFSQYWDCILME